jgi:hypothetical protein
MNERLKVIRLVNKKLKFFKRIGSTWHCQSWTVAYELGVPEKVVREVFVSMARWGLVTLRSWNNSAWREVNYYELAADSFFFNRDDGGHVRIRPCS